MPIYRRHPRAPLNVLLNKIVGDMPFMCQSTDISEEGIWLTKLIEPRHGETEVGIEILLPGEREVVEARGEIVREGRRRANEGTAVRFTLLAEPHRLMIRRYVEGHDLAA